MTVIKVIVEIQLVTFGSSVLPEAGSVESGWVVKVVYEDKTSRTDPFLSREGAIRFISHLVVGEMTEGRAGKVTFHA